MAETLDREDIVAILPCGCVVIVMVVRRPASNKTPAHQATAADFARFYKSVADAQTRKKNPLNLTVLTVPNGKDLPWGCAKCKPQGSLFKSD